MANALDLENVLRRLHEAGQTRVTAEIIAGELWPASKHRKVIKKNLSASAAGRMLRRCAAVHEIEFRLWEILPDKLI